MAKREIILSTFDTCNCLVFFLVSLSVLKGWTKSGHYKYIVCPGNNTSTLTLQLCII